MESPQHIKSRLKSVKNIGQITKAMEVVSATKMRKAQEVALRSRPYAYRALELLETLMNSIKNQVVSSKVEIPLAQARDVKNTLIVIVSSDRGLAGAFNTQVIRTVENYFRTNNAGEYRTILVGKKAVSYVSKRGMNVVKTFTGFGDYALSEQVEPLQKLVVEGFINGSWDRVVTVSTHFRSTLKQETLVRQILPLDIGKISETVQEIIPERGRYAELSGSDPTKSEKRTANASPPEFIFEPSPQETISELLPHLINMQLYHLILEANASEHSARMVAMKTASDNASELADDLTLEFNKARQASITKEIIEITSTMNALQ